VELDPQEGAPEVWLHNHAVTALAVGLFWQSQKNELQALEAARDDRRLGFVRVKCRRLLPSYNHIRASGFVWVSLIRHWS